MNPKIHVGEPVDEALPWVRRVHDLDDAWNTSGAGPRLRMLRRHAERLGDRLREGERAVSVRTIAITDLAYPAAFAFGRALKSAFPYVLLRHRCLLVQVRVAADEVRTILFNPTDRQAGEATPFFRGLKRRFSYAGRWVETRHGTVEAGLLEVGLSPEDVDVIAFDHFHAQDLRPLFGTTGDGLRPRIPARFPRAKLLAPRCEWNDWDDLHPLQRPFFVRDGKRGIDPGRVVLTDGDLTLGAGALLLRTPGHTSGNQTLFVHTDEGVFGCSENGCSADSWSPYESRLPGLLAHAKRFDAEVVLNSNTLERGADQYSSMVVERSMVDRFREAPAFVQMFPSSEMVPSALAPGLRPSVLVNERSSGTLVLPAGRTHPAAQSEPADLPG